MERSLKGQRTVGLLDMLNVGTVWAGTEGDQRNCRLCENKAALAETDFRRRDVRNGVGDVLQADRRLG